MLSDKLSIFQVSSCQPKALGVGCKRQTLSLGRAALDSERVQPNIMHERRAATGRYTLSRIHISSNSKGQKGHLHQLKHPNVPRPAVFGSSCASASAWRIMAISCGLGWHPASLSFTWLLNACRKRLDCGRPAESSISGETRR